MTLRTAENARPSSGPTVRGAPESSTARPDGPLRTRAPSALELSVLYDRKGLQSASDSENTMPAAVRRGIVSYLQANELSVPHTSDGRRFGQKTSWGGEPLFVFTLFAPQGSVPLGAVAIDGAGRQVAEFFRRDALQGAIGGLVDRFEQPQSNVVGLRRNATDAERERDWDAYESAKAHVDEVSSRPSIAGGEALARR